MKKYKILNNSNVKNMFNTGIKYKTDKITHHGYHRFYDFFLYPFKNKTFNFFEIGVDAGRSLKMWNDYFTNAKIYGMDIDHEYEHEKGKVFKGDQSKIEDLNKIINEIKVCDFIIDDGSHVPEHQLLTFNYLFDNLLNFGGIYIIEDIETSYWKKSTLYGYEINSGYNKKNNIVNIFKNITDIVNSEFLSEKNINTIKKYNKINFNNLKLISFIMFGHNCIIIKKMTKQEYEKYGKRKYRFIENLHS
jgi:hypothetical protein